MNTLEWIDGAQRREWDNENRIVLPRLMDADEAFSAVDDDDDWVEDEDDEYYDDDDEYYDEDDLEDDEEFEEDSDEDLEL